MASPAQNIHSSNNTDTHYVRGEERYLKRVLVEADALWTQNKDDGVHLMAWIQAMHDLADFYQKQGELTEAYHYLITPHNWLINLLHDTSRAQEDVAMTLHALRMTFEPLYQFSQTHPCCDNCRQSLEEVRQMLEVRSKQIH